MVRSKVCRFVQFGKNKVCGKRDGELLKSIVFVILRMMGRFKSNNKNCILYLSIYILCIIFGSIGSIIGSINTSGIIGKIETLGMFSAALAYNCIYAITLLSGDKIEKLLHILRGDHTEDVDICGEYIINQTCVSNKGKMILFVCVYLGLTVSFLIPSFWVFLSNPEYSEMDESLDVISYWLSCGESEHNGMLGSICWKAKTKLQYLFKNFLEFVFTLMIFAASNYCIAVYSVVMAEFCVHLRIFEDKVANLVKSADWFNAKFQNLRVNDEMKSAILKDFDEAMIHEFKNVIKYQQFLRRCAHEVKTTFKYYNGVVISEYFVALIFVMLMVFYKSRNVMLFKCIPITIHEILSISMLCYFAQIISDTNEVISRNICDIPWHEQNTQFRKIYVMVLAQNNLQIQVKLFNARVLGLGFLLSAFRSLYSVLNLLLLEIGK